MKEQTFPRLTSAELLSELEKACEKLIYISETDSPVEPFLDSQIGAVSSATVTSALQRNANEAVEEANFSVFFEKLTREREWHTPAQERMRQRFAALKDLLTENLDDPRVFRFGTIRIDIYAVGKDSEGNLAGVKTVAVET